jgi:hypothetical protein
MTALPSFRLLLVPDNANFGVSSGVEGLRLDETTMGDTANTGGRPCNQGAQLSAHGECCKRAGERQKTSSCQVLAVRTDRSCEFVGGLT